MSGSTVGLLAIISLFQYQSPITNPTYTTAISQASKAAYIQSGGQALQDKTAGYVTKQGTDIVHSIGITDPEMAVVVGAYKTFRDKSINVNGPKIYSLTTHLTANQNSGSIGLGWSFK